MISARYSCKSTWCRTIGVPNMPVHLRTTRRRRRNKMSPTSLHCCQLWKRRRSLTSRSALPCQSTSTLEKHFVYIILFDCFDCFDCFFLTLFTFVFIHFYLQKNMQCKAKPVVDEPDDTAFDRSKPNVFSKVGLFCGQP